MKTAFIVNPVAGRGRARRVWNNLLPTVEDQGYSKAVAYTEGLLHAKHLAEGFANKGYQRVVAVGGDGTVHEVINGLVGTDTTLAYIPAGTGNDFVRSLGIGSDPREALSIINSPEKGVEVTIDLGVVNGRYFMNAAGVGYDADVVNDTNSRPKYLGGPIPYIMSVLRQLVHYSPKPVEIVLDEMVVTTRVLLVAAGNGAYYGGGMCICPEADLHDGKLEVCIARDLGRLEALGLLTKVFNGSHVEHPKVDTYRVSKLMINAETPLALQTDGEVIGTTPAMFQSEPGAIRVLADPKKYRHHRQIDRQADRLSASSISLGSGG